MAFTQADIESMRHLMREDIVALGAVQRAARQNAQATAGTESA